MTCPEGLGQLASSLEGLSKPVSPSVPMVEQQGQLGQPLMRMTEPVVMWQGPQPLLLVALLMAALEWTAVGAR